MKKGQIVLVALIGLAVGLLLGRLFVPERTSVDRFRFELRNTSTSGRAGQVVYRFDTHTGQAWEAFNYRVFDKHKQEGWREIPFESKP